MPQFPFAGGELQLGGRPLSRVAAQVGQTPFYAYDRALLRRARGRAARGAAAGGEAALRDEGQPDAGAGGPHGRAGRRHRRGVGRAS
jgi:diaminopimelate decarboxylase